MRDDPKAALLKVLAGVVLVLVLVALTGSQAVPWALLLVVLGLAAGVVYVWAVVLRAIYLSRHGPIHTARGIVTRKYTREYTVDLSGRRSAFDGGANGPEYESWNFWVAFDVGDAELEFRVPERIYTTLDEGAPYAITYRGEKLIDAVSLAPPKPAAPPPDPLTSLSPPPPPPPPPDSDLRPLG